jgi:hypothetical protein
VAPSREERAPPGAAARETVPPREPAAPPSAAPPRPAQAAKSAPPPAAAALHAAPVVSGHLTVASRAAAVRALAALAARHGGRASADAAGTTVEAVVPRGAWAGFVRELGTLGRLALDREPAELPETVGLALRLAE